MGLGSTAVGDIGPHTALMSPNGRACGDWGIGPVRLTGTAPASITWYITGTDLDYAFVGTVFTTTNTTFTPGPDLTLLTMCVHNPIAHFVGHDQRLAELNTMFELHAESLSQP